MKLFIPISRDGASRPPTIATDIACSVYTTSGAYSKIYETMRAQGNICKRCQIIARSSELTDGQCSPGWGCDLDVDTRAIEMLMKGDSRLASALITDIWDAYIKLLPHRGDPAPGMPSRERTPQDAFWW